MDQDYAYLSLFVFYVLMWLASKISLRVFDQYGVLSGYLTLIGLGMVTLVLMLMFNVRLGVTQWANFLPPSWATYLTSSGW